MRESRRMNNPQGIDREALRARYRDERDKRLRPDGNEQYLEPTGRFAHFLDDPVRAERSSASRVHDEVTVAFIGGGFAGLVTGARLKQAGIDDVRIIEGGGDVGGAWYWNRYPGAMCDTAAMVYLPLLEETGHMPTQKYVFAPEIFDHAQRIATTFGLYDNALFSTAGHRARLGRRRRSRWIIRTDRGDAIRAKFVGHGHRPAAPAEAARHPRHRDLRRPQLPHQPLGLRLHRRRLRGRADDQPGRQAGRHHRHRRHRGAVHPAPRPATRRSCSCSSARRRRSTCATTTRSTPSGSPRSSRAGSSEWLMNFATLQTGGFADEDLVKDGWTDISQRIRDRMVEMVKDGTPR